MFGYPGYIKKIVILIHTSYEQSHGLTLNPIECARTGVSVLGLLTMYLCECITWIGILNILELHHHYLFS